ncbi:M2 family metallopeptidase [Planctomycetota bacterium]
MKRMLAFLSITAILYSLMGCAHPPQEEITLNTFIDKHVARVKPMAKEAHLAYWEAAITGDTEAYGRVSRLELQIRSLYSDSDDYAQLKALRASGKITDPVLARQLDVLINIYLENQIAPDLLKEIVDLSTDLEKRFSTFRGTINGKEVTSNEIKDILKDEINMAQRRKAWEASKQVAGEIGDDLVRLVKLRNQAARKLGFSNYHTLSLTAAEQDVVELDRVFQELYELTNVPFAQLKLDLDRRLAESYGIPVADLRPWHYHDPFFQETPMVYDLDLDSYYEQRDVAELSQAYFAGIGLPVDAILARSDLYEREDKNPHAFCTDIDREGDVRILCNLRNNEQWMETILHELGHAVYDEQHSPDVPYLLREPAHIFTTEAIAMLFGRLSRNPDWMQQMLDLSDDQRAEIETVSAKYAQLKQLIFARWAMVMFYFEKSLYANPNQNLNKLWWDMVEKYQFVTRPEGRDAPDWAAKIHFCIAPCYYHNYMLGELFASQLHHTLVFKVLRLPEDNNTSYVGQEVVGDFLKERVFAPGKLDPWDIMIEKATGESLTAKYYVEQFVNH